MTNERVAFLGLGNMGKGMVTNIALKADLQHPIALWNRTASRATSLSSSLPPHSTTVADSPTSATKDATIIFTSLSNDSTVLSVYSTLLSTPVTNKLFIETSTIHPTTTSTLCTLASDAGAHLIAMPVFGAPAAADSGSLIACPAGPAECVQRVLPFLDGVMSRATINLSGHAPSHANLLKLTGNTFILSMVETLAEGLVFAEKSGLGTDVLHQFVAAMFPGPYAGYSERMRSGDYYTREEPLFAVGLARKDAGHAMSLAGDVGVRLRVVELVDERLKEVERARGEKGDLPAVYGAVRVEAGLSFGNVEGKE